MAEWKTWSFGDLPGDDGRHGDQDGPVSSGDVPTGPMRGRGVNPPPGEGAPAQKSPAEIAAEKWSPEVEPFTLERAATVMAGDGFPVTRDVFSVTTVANGQAIRVHREPADAPWMQVEGRVPLPEGTDAGAVDPFDLQQTANTWNSQHLQPTVIPTRADELFFFHLSTRFFIGEGASDRQIHLMITRGVVVTLQAARDLPGLVTPPEDA